jgi:hypothetical protein
MKGNLISVFFLICLTIVVNARGAVNSANLVPNADITTPKIIFITDDNYDDTNINFLKRQGFDVIKMWFPAGLGASTEDTIDMLNAVDLVIIGRSGPSPSFQQPTDKAAWNGLEVPLMLICRWKARQSRLNWFNIESLNSCFIPTETNDGTAVVPNDPIFDDVTLDKDNSLVWTYMPDEYIIVRKSSNGTWIVNRGDTIPLLVRFETNVPFYPGATDSAAGPRTFFDMGNDSYGPPNYFPLTREAKKVYLAEVCRMMNVPVPEIVYGAPDFSITFVTDDEYDKACITFLEKQGFRIKIFWPTNGLGAVGQDIIDMLNAEDLVIIGRSGPSASFQQPADKEAWNGLTSPQILNCPWKARSRRLNWFNNSDGPALPLCIEGTTTAFAIDPNDPVFEFASGVEADGFIAEWSFCVDDCIYVWSPFNGTTVVNRGDTIPLVVRWNANERFYPTATDSCAGPRTYFGMGNEAYGPVNFFPLTKTGQAVYFAEALRLVGAPIYEPVYLDEERTLSSLAVEGITLVPAFHKDTLNYAIVIPAGTDSFLITATATSEVAVVSGAGWRKTPPLPNTIPVICTAENGRSLWYMIRTTGEETGIQNHAVMHDNCLVHPNPVTNMLIITAKDVINSVSVFNLQGVIVMSRIVGSRSVELPVSRLNKGIYFIKVQSGNNIYMRKIIKE